MKTALIKLTSNDVRQNQQNTCLQRLHIICAHPASLSMGTLHIGQRFISPSIEPPPGNIRLSPACPISRPLDADAVFIKPLLLVLLALEAEVKRAFPFCAQVIPGCQLAEHREQNSLSHVGHFTGTGSIFL